MNSSKLISHYYSLRGQNRDSSFISQPSTAVNLFPIPFYVLISRSLHTSLSTYQ